MGDWGIKGNLLCSGHKVIMPYRRQTYLLCNKYGKEANICIRKGICQQYLQSALSRENLFEVIKRLAVKSRKNGDNSNVLPLANRIWVRLNAEKCLSSACFIMQSRKIYCVCIRLNIYPLLASLWKAGKYIVYVSGSIFILCLLHYAKQENIENMGAQYTLCRGRCLSSACSIMQSRKI